MKKTMDMKKKKTNTDISIGTQTKTNIFKKFETMLLQHVSEDSLILLEKSWQEKSRVYHNISHLIQILKDIESNIWFNELSVVEKHTLVLAAFFHDAIYDPKKKDNEDRSIEFFKKAYIGKDQVMIKKVSDLIEITKHRKRPFKFLERILWDADNVGFLKGYDNLFKNEKLIQKEYSFVSKKEYKKGRTDFLKSNIGLFNSTVDTHLNKLIKYIEKNF